MPTRPGDQALSCTWSFLQDTEAQEYSGSSASISCLPVCRPRELELAILQQAPLLTALHEEPTPCPCSLLLRGAHQSLRPPPHPRICSGKEREVGRPGHPDSVLQMPGPVRGEGITNKNPKTKIKENQRKSFTIKLSVIIHLKRHNIRNGKQNTYNHNRQKRNSHMQFTPQMAIT